MEKSNFNKISLFISFIRFTQDFEEKKIPGTTLKSFILKYFEDINEQEGKFNLINERNKLKNQFLNFNNELIDILMQIDEKDIIFSAQEKPNKIDLSKGLLSINEVKKKLNICRDKFII